MGSPVNVKVCHTNTGWEAFCLEVSKHMIVCPKGFLSRVFTHIVTNRLVKPALNQRPFAQKFPRIWLCVQKIFVKRVFTHNQACQTKMVQRSFSLSLQAYDCVAKKFPQTGLSINPTFASQRASCSQVSIPRIWWCPKAEPWLKAWKELS